MVRRIIDKRRAKKKDDAPRPQPYWAEAFMILLLHKTGGSLTVPLKSLENFEKLKKVNKTIMSYDSENKTVTITAPEINVVFVPNKRII